MSDTIKVVIEMSKKAYEFTKDARTARCFPSEYYVKMILNGTPLDDVKAEIQEKSVQYRGQTYDGLCIALKMLDNIDKEEKEGINDRTISDRKM